MNSIALSKTECNVIEMRIAGLSRKEIADKSYRSEKTIKTHFQNIHKKLNLNEEIQVVVWYIENVLDIDIKKTLKVAASIALILFVEFTANSNVIRTRTVRTGKGQMANRASRAKTGRILKLEFA